MTIKAADLAALIDQDHVPLSQGVLGIPGGDTLFGPDWLGATVTVDRSKTDRDNYILWGTTQVKGHSTPVEIHFYPGSDADKTIIGAVLYADLAGQWEPAGYPDLKIKILTSPWADNAFKKPEARLAAGVDPRGAFTLTGTARFGPDTEPGTVPHRLRVTPSSPGVLDFLAELGKDGIAVDGPDGIIAAIPIPLFPQYHLPTDLGTLVHDLHLNVSAFRLTLREDLSTDNKPEFVGVDVTAGIGSATIDHEVIPGFFTANSLDITLRLTDKDTYSVGARFAGKLCGGETVLQGWYGKNGTVRLNVAVQSVHPDEKFTSWMNDAVGHSIADTLSHGTIDALSVEGTYDKTLGMGIRAGLALSYETQHPGMPVHFTFDAYRPPGGTGNGSVSASLNVPVADTAGQGLRMMTLTGQLVTREALVFDLDWSADKDPGKEIKLADLVALFSDTVNDSLPDVGLSKVKAHAEPSKGLFVLTSVIEGVTVTLAVVGTGTPSEDGRKERR